MRCASLKHAYSLVASYNVAIYYGVSATLHHATDEYLLVD